MALPEIHRLYLDQLTAESSSPGIDLVRLIVEPEPTAVDRAKVIIYPDRSFSGEAIRTLGSAGCS